MRDHVAVQLVIRRLAELGATGAVRVLDDAARTAAQAAIQLGVAPAQIANSLVFAAIGHRESEQDSDRDSDRDSAAEPVLVLASGGHRVDTAKVARLLHVDRVDRADPNFVRAHTGFAIGGVAPVGHPHPLRTLVDTDLAAYDQVWAAAGHPHAVFPTTFDELLRLTGGTPAEVGQR